MERIINNGLPINQLTKQFRMRPEIMSLVLPFISDQFENSEYTLNSPNIIGMTKNVYFIDHDIIEVNYIVSYTTLICIKLVRLFNF